MISVKDGVNIAGIRPEITMALHMAASVLIDHGYDTIITSVCDGKHGHGSLHYIGCAADIRTRHIPKEQRQGIRDMIAEVLGAQFDVVLESTHIHIEFQPK